MKNVLYLTLPQTLTGVMLTGQPQRPAPPGGVSLARHSHRWDLYSNPPRRTSIRCWNFAFIFAKLFIVKTAGVGDAASSNSGQRKGLLKAQDGCLGKLFGVRWRYSVVIRYENGPGEEISAPTRTFKQETAAALTVPAA